MATENIHVTLEEVKAAALDYINANKIALPTFSATIDNTAGLLDRIGKQYTITGQIVDHFPEMDGDDLPFGKTLEEYFADIIKVSNVNDGSDEHTLKPIPFMKPCYSYQLGDEKISYTILLDDLNRCVDDAGALAELAAAPAVVSQNSFTLYRENCKIALLSKYGDAIVSAQNDEHTVFAASTNYKVGVYLQDAVTASRTATGVVVKEIPASGGPATWALAVSGGYVTVFDLVTTLAMPTDTASGEAFIKDVKKYAKKAQWTTQGTSLNGNTVGSGSVVIYMADDYGPSIEVDTLAGAINADKLSIGVVSKALPYLIGSDKKIMAIMIDSRAAKLHKTFDQTLDDGLAEQKARKFVRWFNHTAAFSRNTFVHVWLKS